MAQRSLGVRGSWCLRSRAGSSCGSPRAQMLPSPHPLPGHPVCLLCLISANKPSWRARRLCPRAPAGLQPTLPGVSGGPGVWPMRLRGQGTGDGQVTLPGWAGGERGAFEESTCWQQVFFPPEHIFKSNLLFLDCCRFARSCRKHCGEIPRPLYPTSPSATTCRTLALGLGQDVAQTLLLLKILFKKIILNIFKKKSEVLTIKYVQAFKLWNSEKQKDIKLEKMHTKNSQRSDCTLVVNSCSKRKPSHVTMGQLNAQFSANHMRVI